MMSTVPSWKQRAEELFLLRCEQITAIHNNATKAVELLDIAAKLRELLFDKHSIVDAVNTSDIKLRFLIGATHPIDFNVATTMELYHLGEAIDPLSIPADFPHQDHFLKATVTRDELGKHIVAYLDKKPITVKTAVRYGSNVAGGIHFDPNNSSPEYEALRLFEDAFSMGGMSAGTAVLRPLARVVLRGLSPLIEDVEGRIGGR